ncbi:hypothetical protein C8J56DRAFT_897489 [Mycena floridula]|nr:hypothetical protein C8J56DRAFT_897489 [Mycena floridula]
MPQSFSNQSDFIPFFNGDPSAKPSMPQPYNGSKHRGPRYYEPNVRSSQENSYGSPRLEEHGPIDPYSHPLYNRNRKYRHDHVRAAGIRPRPYPSSDSRDKRRHSRSRSMLPQRSERSERSDEHVHRPCLAIPKTVDDVLNVIDIASKDSNRLDAVRILISLLDQAQWVKDPSTPMRYLIQTEWQPPHWYFNETHPSEQAFKHYARRQFEYAQIDAPYLDRRYMPIPNSSSSETPSTKSSSSPNKPTPVLIPKKVIVIDDPKILPDWDELPNMLKYLVQSTKRLYGVPFEGNKLIVRGVRGAMMFLSRVPLGDGTECPIGLDLMFLYVCSYIAASPGRYLELLSKENYGIAKGKVARKRFPYTDPSDFTNTNVVKFFADQGKLPCDFDDGFVWAIAFAKRMAFDSNIPPEQSIHFFNIHKAGLRLETMGLAPPGFPAGPEGVLYSCLPRPRDSKKGTSVNLPKSDAGISRARPTKSSDVANSIDLALATNTSLSLHVRSTVKVEPNDNPARTENPTESSTMDTRPDLTVAIQQPPAVIINAPSFPTSGIPGMTAFTFGAISPQYSPVAPAMSGIPQDVGVDSKLIMPIEPDEQDHEDFDENLADHEEETH